jgi:hypothetical protein
VRGHAEPARVGDRIDDLARVGQHLGRDAADVEAGAAEALLLLDDCDVEVGERVVDHPVARAGSDDEQIVVRHAFTPG